jgi:putative FmdB family regulatory protein
MPLYEYECDRHGVFELTRSMHLASLPAPCPACRRKAARILSLPSVAQVGRSERIARDRNEKSRHEPRMVSVERPSDSGNPRPLRAASHARPWAAGH